MRTPLDQRDDIHRAFEKYSKYGDEGYKVIDRHGLKLAVISLFGYKPSKVIWRVAFTTTTLTPTSHLFPKFSLK